MKTIASVVEEYIKTKPFLSTALSQGIINLTSLSREIQPEIEKILNREIYFGEKENTDSKNSSEWEF